MAVWRILGTSFPTEGPGLSARIRCRVKPCPFCPGATASRKTNIPMPPSQWVKLRQKSSPLLMASTSVRMEAPVVVKPETVSKKQSTRLGISPLK